MQNADGDYRASTVRCTMVPDQLEPGMVAAALSLRSGAHAEVRSAPVLLRPHLAALNRLNPIFWQVPRRADDSCRLAMRRHSTPSSTTLRDRIEALQNQIRDSLTSR
jgi:hypothetical protein